MHSIKTELPALYAGLLPDFFESEIHNEKFATCKNCAMVCTDRPKQKLAVSPFSAETKCCTFYPSIPNYLIGGLLSDNSGTQTEGQKRIRERIRDRVSITPAGVYAPRMYELIYDNMDRAAFGNSKSLLCPYFVSETGSCSIWKYREAVCSTFFCKTISGYAGKLFWTSLKNYLFKLEEQLSIYCIMELNLPNALEVIGKYMSKNQKSRKLTVEDIEQKPILNDDYAKLWGEWAGREEEFYIACFRAVEKLDKEQTSSIMGIKQAVLLKDVTERRKKMLSIPLVLKKNEKIKLKTPAADSYEIYLQHSDMSFELPSVAIDCFDGKREYKEIKKHLDQNEGIEMDDELILTLYQHSILVEA